MDGFINLITQANGFVNGLVWGLFGVMLLVCTGIIMTCLTKFFQVTHFAHWMKNTIGSILHKNISSHSKEKESISQFQALCTALAATVGVGNIAGVATAIATGGPGAVFWMWVAAFFGMMTHYSESVLSIYYRRRNASGEWTGGAMYYLQDGLGGKKHCKKIGRVLAILFSCFAVLASFGIGNLSQVNTIASNLSSAFEIKALTDITVGGTNLYMIIIGIVLMIFAGLVVVGGIKRVGSVTEKFVPFMVIFYIVGALVIVGYNYQNIIPAIGSVFRFAFGVPAIAGGAAGIAVKEVMTMGLKRGVFSNEAGLGSSAMVHSASNVKEPVRQGMWGIFEVFADTIIICTLTALVVLTSGLVDLDTGRMLTDAKETVLVSDAFKTTFTAIGGESLGAFGGGFIAIAILLFAFSTVLGWSYYGTKAWEYLFGTKSTIIYKIVFVATIICGATMSLDLAWNISDTFNGLMMIPNLIGVLSLSGLVMKITKNYVDRKLKNKKDVEPMLSAFDDIQTEQVQKMKDDGEY